MRGVDGPTQSAGSFWRLLMHPTVSQAPAHQPAKSKAHMYSLTQHTRTASICVTPTSSLPGHKKALAARQAVVGAMLQHPPKLFKPRVRAAVVRWRRVALAVRLYWCTRRDKAVLYAVYCSA